MKGLKSKLLDVVSCTSGVDAYCWELGKESGQYPLQDAVPFPISPLC